MTLIAHAGFCIFAAWASQEIAGRRHASIVFWSTLTISVYALVAGLVGLPWWQALLAALAAGVGLQWLAGHIAFFTQNRFLQAERDLDRWIQAWWLNRARRKLDAAAANDPCPYRPHDDVCRDPDVADRIAKSIRAGEWSVAAAAYRGLPAGRRRLALQAALAGMDVGRLRDWIAAQPEEAVARLAAGIRHLDLAFEARGTGWSETVTATGIVGFYEHLSIAHELLESAAVDPDCSCEAHLRLIGCKLGMSAAIDSFWPHFIKALKNQRTDLAPHTSMINVLTPKWLGSSELMFDFARRSVRDISDGCALWGLVANAHIEESREMERDDEAPQGASLQYLRSDPVIAELDEAFARLTGGIVGEPDEDQARALNMFAYVYFLLEDIERLAAAMTPLGDRMYRYPWFYGKDKDIYYVHPQYAFRDARRLASLEG